MASTDWQQQLREYYREKRVQRILNLTNPRQPSYATRKKNGMEIISRDSALRFGITIFCIPLFVGPLSIFTRYMPIPIGMIFTALGLIAAVEVSDYVWLRLRRVFDFMIDIAIPVFVVAAVIFVVVGVRFFNGAEVASKRFGELRRQVNKDLAKPLETPFSVSGENWFFVSKQENGKNFLLQVTLAEAMAACTGKGPDWNLPLESAFATLEPKPNLPRSLYLWLRGGVRAGGFSGQINDRPRTFVSPAKEDAADARNFTICVHEVTR